MSYRFTDKRSDEQIIRTLRQHKIVFLPAIIYSIVILAVSLALFYFFAIEAWLMTLLIVLTILAPCLIIYYYWFLWDNDVYILTNERLIDVDQNALFNRVVNEMPLDKIQDVTYEIIGLLPSVFNFGRVIIKTAGPQEDVVIENIAYPARVTQEISATFKSYREEVGQNYRSEDKKDEQNVS